MKKLLPGKFAHTLAILLTFLLTLVLLITPLCWQGIRVLTDRDLHASVALDDRVTTAQMTRIQAVIDVVAMEQPFDPDVLADLINLESIEQYNLNVIDWWMGLLKEDPVIVSPEWDAEALQEAVRTSAAFQEAIPSTQRRTVARDKVAYPISQEIKETVLPIRTQLLTIALPKVLEKVDVPSILTLLTKAPLALAAVSAGLALLVLLTMHRRLCKGLLYLGSALTASSLLTLLLCGGVLLLNPCAVIAQGSELLAMQVALLGQAIALPIGVLCAADLVVGLIFIGIHQKRMTCFYAGSIAA